MSDVENRELFELLAGGSTPAKQAAALKNHFSEQALTDGSAVSAYGGQFVWAIAAETRPHLYVDDAPAVPMRSLPAGLWAHTAKLRTGTSHAHYFRVDGKILGGKRYDTAAFGPDSFPREGVPEGKLSDELIHESVTYGGWKVSYWVYASPGVDAAKASAVMVWQDGQRFVERGKRSRIMTVVDNLVEQKKFRRWCW